MEMRKAGGAYALMKQSPPWMARDLIHLTPLGYQEMAKSLLAGHDSPLVVSTFMRLIQSDNGPEFTARALRAWLATVGARRLYIEPGSPCENGHCESFNGRLRDGLLAGEICYSLRQARVVIERWPKEYSTVRPHSSLGYRPPAPAAINPTPPALEQAAAMQ